jgi:hypothetical protein
MHAPLGINADKAKLLMECLQHNNRKERLQWFEGICDMRRTANDVSWRSVPNLSR